MKFLVRPIQSFSIESIVKMIIVSGIVLSLLLMDISSLFFVHEGVYRSVCALVLTYLKSSLPFGMRQENIVFLLHLLPKVHCPVLSLSYKTAQDLEKFYK